MGCSRRRRFHWRGGRSGGGGNGSGRSGSGGGWRIAGRGTTAAARAAAITAQDAALANAQAQLQRARVDLARVDELVSDGSVALRERDQNLAAHAQAEAQVRQSGAALDMARQDLRTVEVGRDALVANVEAAHAQLRLAQIDLDNTVIRAAEDGQLGEVGVRLG